MNRKIKFRVWDKTNNTMYDEYDGGESEITALLAGYLLAGNNDSDTEDDCIMQFTGLKDRNENEIYEGDICKVYEENTDDSAYFTIEWDKDCAKFVVTGDGLIYDFDNLHPSQLEVYGNIFENKDLLGGEK